MLRDLSWNGMLRDLRWCWEISGDVEISLMEWHIEWSRVKFIDQSKCELSHHRWFWEISGNFERSQVMLHVEWSQVMLREKNIRPGDVERSTGKLILRDHRGCWEISGLGMFRADLSISWLWEISGLSWCVRVSELDKRERRNMPCTRALFKEYNYFGIAQQGQDLNHPLGAIFYCEVLYIFTFKNPKPFNFHVKDTCI